MSVWAEAIAEARQDRSFVYVGPGDSWFDALRSWNVEVSAHVDTARTAGQSSASPSAPTWPIGREDEPVSPLGPGWQAQREEAVAIASFLDRHDPRRTAPILSLHSIAPSMTRDRQAWATDADLACRLETKTSVGAVLEHVVPWMPAEPLPAGVDDEWFEQVTDRHAVDSLAVQELGLSWYGEKTWRCQSAAEVARIVARCPAVRIAPWLEGVPINIGGAVSIGGEVIVLPPSGQLIVPDQDGRPLYFGNMIGTLGDAEVDATAGHAQAVGAALASLGYVGMFGVDGVVAAGRVRYHDLNPRVNGAMVAYDQLAPVMVGLLLFSGWANPARISGAARELDAAARAGPSARWRLGLAVGRSGSVGPVPVAGLYRLDPAGPALTFLEPDTSDASGSVRQDIVLIRPRSSATTAVHAGQRVALADLWCAAELADALISNHGARVVDRLVQATRHAARG